MGFIKNITTRIITYAVIIVLLGVGIKFIGIDMLWKNFKEKTNKIAELVQSNKDAEKVYQDSLATITALNTVREDELQTKLNKLQYNSKFYKDVVDSLKEQLTAVHTGRGDVVIRDSADVPEFEAGRDSVVIPTDFVTITYDKTLDRIYTKLEFTIKLTGIETTDKYGDKRVIENVFVVSKKDTTKFVAVDWTGDFIFLKSKNKLWHLWNPKLHSDIIPSNPMKFGMSVNIMSFGTDRYIETTTLYFMCFGIASDFKEEAMLVFFPVKYNIGQILPLIDNLNLGIGAGWNFYNTIPSLQFSLGMVH